MYFGFLGFVLIFVVFVVFREKIVEGVEVEIS